MTLSIQFFKIFQSGLSPSNEPTAYLTNSQAQTANLGFMAQSMLILASFLAICAFFVTVPLNSPLWPTIHPHTPQGTIILLSHIFHHDKSDKLGFYATGQNFLHEDLPEGISTVWFRDLEKSPAGVFSRRGGNVAISLSFGVDKNLTFLFLEIGSFRLYSHRSRFRNWAHASSKKSVFMSSNGIRRHNRLKNAKSWNLNWKNIKNCAKRRINRGDDTKKVRFQ